jgi:hypothetical protein
MMMTTIIIIMYKYLLQLSSVTLVTGSQPLFAIFAGLLRLHVLKDSSPSSFYLPFPHNFDPSSSLSSFRRLGQYSFTPCYLPYVIHLHTILTRYFECFPELR